jgi:hypothetical protein
MGEQKGGIDKSGKCNGGASQEEIGKTNKGVTEKTQTVHQENIDFCKTRCLSWSGDTPLGSERLEAVKTKTWSNLQKGP